jgi:uncharacterized protein YgfB (UPF0149 family)
MATKRSELEQELNEAQESLESISELAAEGLDPELSREEVISKLKEIADLAPAEEGEEEGEESGE